MRVVEPGLFTTVQDLGREGFGPMGVSASGAADPLSLRIGNRLVGNPESAAALEMTLLGGTFEFTEAATVVLAGSDFGVECWRPIDLKPGQILKLGPTRSGARCYLCVRGGFEVPMFLGSASTHILSGLGGFEGRALKKGDVLRIGTAFASSAMPQRIPEARKVLRVTRGPQADWFFASLGDGVYRVTEEANRMGLRLEGPPIASEGEMITEGVSLGAIQITPSGQPIILFVDQQTTGGYPKIANVIAADLPSVGQLRPRDEIRFEEVSVETAVALLREQEDALWI